MRPDRLPTDAAPRDWPRRELRVDGARLSCIDVGAGDAVLLLHGYPQSALCWRHQIGPLAAQRRVLAPDWFGWGESERSLRLAPRYGEEVARIDHVADALGLDRFDLIVHDYGGYLGLDYVIRHGARVRRFAILNSRAHRTFPGRYYLQFAALCFAARLPVIRSALRHAPIGAAHRASLQRYVRLGCFDAALLERYVAWMDTADGRRWFVHFFAHYDVRVEPALAAGLDANTCPTAIIWGDRDPYCPFEIAEHLAHSLPRAALTRVVGADHYVMEERPAEVLDALEALLAAPAD